MIKKQCIFLLTLICFQSISHSEAVDLTTLDCYLTQHGFNLSPVHSIINDGYSSLGQRKAFADALQKLPYVKRIAEIGFNAGHSSEVFLENCPNASLIAFDLNTHRYTKFGIDYMKKKFGERFKLIEGDSRYKVPEFALAYRGEKFDLIFIDGGHSYQCCLDDIINCQKLADNNAILWVDDYNYWEVRDAVDACAKNGLIAITDVKSVNDESGLRVWAEAVYVAGKNSN
jgi:predicted O-methyltransferase YrrM